MNEKINVNPIVDTAACRLEYTNETRGLAPIPVSERGLPVAIAEPYFQVSEGLLALEGPAFDRQGNLFFVDVYGGQVFRLTPDLRLTTLYIDEQLWPAGIGIHKDGRIFLAGIGNFGTGSVVALAPDGTNVQVIVPPSAGHVIDDMVFDNRGGFYFSDFKGTSTNPAGGIYYVTPDFGTIIPVLPRMSAANGVALSQDATVLWATEFCTSRVHRVELANATTPRPFGTSVTYQCVGRAPDSMRTDVDGNVYVAMYNQGRVLVFNPLGIPIGQILLPGREDNHFLKVTSLAFVPGSREMLIVARDELGGRGSMIFRAEGLARGVTMYSHQ